MNEAFEIITPVTNRIMEMYDLLYEAETEEEKSKIANDIIQFWKEFQEGSFNAKFSD